MAYNPVGAPQPYAPPAVGPARPDLLQDFGTDPRYGSGYMPQAPMNGNSLMSGPQQGLHNMITNTVTQRLQQDNPTFQGETVPGANATQQGVYDQAQGMQGRMLNTQPAIQQQLNAGADPAAVEKYYNENVRNPAQQGFRDTMNTLGERYGSTYGNSGGMLRQMGGAANDFNTNLSGQLAGLQFDERNAAFDRNQQGIQNAFGEQQAYNQNLGAQLAIGGDQRAIQAQQNQGNLAQWNSEQAYNNPWLQLAPLALGTQAKTGIEDPSTLSQVVGAVGGIGSAIGSLYGMA